MRATVIFSSYFVVAYCLMLDKNCTVDDKYTTSAVSCSNKQADSVCNSLYASAKVQAGAEDERPLSCFGTATSINDDYKQTAIDQCAKTCGFCCQTQEHSCQNSRFPRINCDALRPGMCNDPLWREVIAEDCPASCGFCKLGGCIDNLVGCTVQMCLTIGMEDFVMNNCKRTCELCKPSFGGSVCQDTQSRCAQWVAKGYCNNSAYSVATKLSNCAKSCNLC